MDPLQPLYELVDTQLKPGMPIQDPGMPQDTPNSYEHPVISQKKAVDDARKKGIPVEDAHQQVYGDVNLANIQSKAEFAQTLGRIADESSSGNVKPEEGSGSIYAQEVEKQSQEAPSDEDMKTPVDQEVDTQEEFDYHEFDVSYLQKYGRA